MADEVTGIKPPATPETKRTPFEIAYRHVTSSIPPYQEVLRADAEDKVSQLGKYSKRLLASHLEQLDLLKKTLDDFKANQQGFIRRDNFSRLIEHRDLPRRTFTARFARVGEALPVGPQNPQVQLGFHANISAVDPEPISQLYYALSVSREPGKSLERIFQQTNEQIINVNNVSLYKDPETGTKVVSPHGGITFRWQRGEDRAKVGGFVYVGAREHVMELQRAIPLTDFAAMFRLVVYLSGYASQPK